MLLVGLAVGGLAGLVAGWELAAKVEPRIPTPSRLIRRSTRSQAVVRHFLDPCARCPHRRGLRLASSHTA